MSQENTQQQMQEDEIDLRELWKTLLKRKMLIAAVTLAVTIVAVAYVLLATPIYEVKVTLKVGEYKLAANANANVTLANSAELVKELEIVFIDVLKNEENRTAWIERVDLAKKVNNYFDILAQGLSNESAIRELKKVVDYTQKEHQKTLDDVKEFREAQIKQAEGKISLLKNKTIPALKEKILRYTNDIKIYEKNFIAVQENLKEIKSSNPTLATIQINEQRYLADMLITLKDALEKFESEESEFEVLQIPKLEEELNTLKALTKPHNYKNTEIVGTILTNDYSVKPKKKLIVVVAFVTGLMLSVFLAFFLEFIQGSRQEEL